ncbi:hypothetical protein SPYCA_3242 [Sphingopyxis sp. FD7]|nr:hypothetical protein SPYCA_3242 [Sphingopyxis sp. FD7]
MTIGIERNVDQAGPDGLPRGRAIPHSIKRITPIAMNQHIRFRQQMLKHFSIKLTAKIKLRAPLAERYIGHNSRFVPVWWINP